MLETFINQTIGIMGLIMTSAQDVLSSKLVIWGIVYTQALALAIIVTKIAAESLTTYILYTNGDPDSDPTGLLVRSFQSIAAILCIPWILRQMYLMGTAIANDVINIKGYASADLTLLNFGYSVENMMVVLAALGIVAIVFTILIFLQTYIRAAELGSQAITGSIIALNLTSPNRSLWDNWFKKSMVITMSQGLQLFLIKAAFYSLATSIVSPNNPIEALKAFGGFFGWLYVAYKTPSSLQNMVYSSGSSKIAGGVAQAAGNAYIMRRIITKV